jgi:hypothetical protein
LLFRLLVCKPTHRWCSPLQLLPLVVVLCWCEACTLLHFLLLFEVMRRPLCLLLCLPLLLLLLLLLCARRHPWTPQRIQQLLHTCTCEGGCQHAHVVVMQVRHLLQLLGEPGGPPVVDGQRHRP